MSLKRKMTLLVSLYQAETAKGRLLEKSFLIHTYVVGYWPTFGFDRVNFPPTGQYSALFWIQCENNVESTPVFLLFPINQGVLHFPCTANEQEHKKL